MTGHDPKGHHHNARETQIRSDTVAGLELEWVFDEEDFGTRLGAIHGTPVVTKDAIYVGSTTGRFLAINLDGSLRWDYVTLPPSPLLAALAAASPVGGEVSALVGTPIVGGAVYSEREDIVVFADLDGSVYGLSGATGEEVWVQPRVDAHPLGGVGGNSLVLAGSDVVVGFSGLEDVALLLPDYACCSHVGLVAAFDVKRGVERWRYHTIPPQSIEPLPEALAPFRFGPAGADVWGQPTYDARTRTIYIGTGQNYSPNAQGESSGTSDAIIALDARTGRQKWIRQVTSGDIWVRGIPSPDANGKWTDQDFGDAPKIYRLPGGREVVGAAQKSGAFSVMDARTGRLLHSTQLVQQANQLGGLQNGSAYGRHKIYVHGLHGSDPTSSEAPFTGTVKALSPDGTKVLWSFDRPSGLFVGPLALASDVLYLVAPVAEQQSGVDPPQFSLLALHADTGALLASFPFSGRAVSGPVVAEGRVYVVSGNGAIEDIGADDAGSVIALGLPDPS